ncbi:MAG: hypothetical protein BWY06_01761 [Candidatus Latescibacteria bacterium ADurb.Bin168]|nr:MAG: hypothetical protein BWY06_01761 [Candidatus Latescibacteria bacterium ADurb.Bin168]
MLQRGPDHPPRCFTRFSATRQNRAAFIRQETGLLASVRIDGPQEVRKTVIFRVPLKHLVQHLHRGGECTFCKREVHGQYNRLRCPGRELQRRPAPLCRAGAVTQTPGDQPHSGRSLRKPWVRIERTLECFTRLVPFFQSAKCRTKAAEKRGCIVARHTESSPEDLYRVAIMARFGQELAQVRK